MILKNQKTVAVFGAGISGLTVAHEFSKLGYKVLVYEVNKNAGGFSRSDRNESDNMPSEYSWHGIGPWYHNVFDIMKQIPFDKTGSIYEKALSRPILFGLTPDKIGPKFNNTFIFNVFKPLRMTILDKLRISWLLFKTWSAHRRTFEYYSKLNAYEQGKKVCSHQGAKTWRALLGPWVGSDWKRASLHQVGQFFRKSLFSGQSYHHPADSQGPSWVHKGGDGWLLLRAPSNECWFDKWVAYLQNQGVDFFWKESLFRFDFNGTNIIAAYLESGAKIIADIYVLAVNPFAAADIVQRTPQLAEEEQLKLFKPLIQDGPHTQVSFRIAFSDHIAWPIERTAVIVVDSEFNITLFAQEQVWPSEVSLGEGVTSLWTGTACVASEPGRVYGLPLTKCTKEQFVQEILTQLQDCQGLDFLIKEANQGKGFDKFPILKIEVWHEWLFSPQGIKPKQPKWVNTTNTKPYLPNQATSISNLVIAGAHTKTMADLWSIEAAVESGRLAVRVVEPKVRVLTQYKPLILKIISQIDDVFYRIGAPHVLDVFIVTFIGILVFFMFY